VVSQKLSWTFQPIFLQSKYNRFKTSQIRKSDPKCCTPICILAADVTERESSGSYTVEIPFFDFRLHVWAVEDQKRFFRRLFSRQTPLVQIIERVLDGHIYRPCFFPKSNGYQPQAPSHHPQRYFCDGVNRCGKFAAVCSLEKFV
jgi:hypothetical protein